MDVVLLISLAQLLEACTVLCRLYSYAEVSDSCPTCGRFKSRLIETSLDPGVVHIRHMGEKVALGQDFLHI